MRPGPSHREANLISGVAQDLRRFVGVLSAHIGEQNLFAGTNPSGDRLTNLTSSDYDYDFFAPQNSMSAMGQKRT
jgi:hypothetical protein